MENSRFDDILKNKLKELNSSSHPGPDWSRMEKELAEDSLKDQAFDQQVKRKLEAISVAGFAKNSWDNLYELIDKRIQRKRSVLISKSFEISILFLLFLAGHNSGYFYHKMNVQTPQVAEIQQQFASISNSSSIPLKEEDFIDETLHSIDNHQSTNNVDPVLQPSNKSKLALQQLSAIDMQMILSTSAVNKTEDLIIKSMPSSYTASTSGNDVQIDHPGKSEVQEKFNSEEIRHNTLDYISLSKSELPILAVNTKNERKGNWFIEFGVGQEFNQIASQMHEDLQKKIEEKRNNDADDISSKPYYSQNQSFGVQLGYEKDRWAVSSGLKYQNVAYSPNLIIYSGDFTNQIFATHIQEQEYNQFNIPVDFSYSLIDRGRWEVDLHLGAEATLITTSHALLAQTYQEGDRIYNVPSEDINTNILSVPFSRGAFDTKPSASFQSASNKTFYFRTLAGISLQRRINNRFSIFGKVNHFFHPAKIGTEILKTDQINSLSFGIGVRQNIG